MKKQVRLILTMVLLMFPLAGVGAAHEAKANAAARDFQRFDGNQSGWLPGKEFAGPAPVQERKTFKVGDRVEADPLLIGQWRKGRVSKIYLTDAGEINVYEITFDAGDSMLVRADSKNAIRPLGGGNIDETAAATSSPELSVTSRQMYDDYHRNELAAKRKYVGKVVKVTGKIWIIQHSEIVRSYVALTAYGYVDDAVTCYVVDKEQLTSLNKGETISIVGTVSGAYTGSDSVSVEPCRILPADVATKDAPQATRANETKNSPPNAAGIVASWFYLGLINADGSETVLNNRESYLNLKADGTFEHLFGRVSQIGTYSVAGNRLTLNGENRAPRTYNITFGDDGKRTFGLSGKTLTLRNKDGVGYKLER